MMRQTRHTQTHHTMLSAFLLMLLSTGLCSSSAQAHQQKESYTTVLFNERSGNLEVIHRFYIHDAEHALNQLPNMKADLISDAASRQAFADYVGKHFALKNSADKVLALQVVGHEIEGKYFWLYQEMPIPAGLSSLKVKMTALQEVWSRQINQINIEKSGKVRSVRLNKGSEWQSVELD